jgi:Fur family zinc uptake transcriptional regulator
MNVGAKTFSKQTQALLDRADAICAERGARLTDLRRQVLGLILQEDQPTGAYDLLDRLRATRQGAAPPTVYRALDFLLEHGLIHRLERLSAFVGCVAPEDGANDHTHHAAQFLICRECGRVVEIDDPDLAHALADAARKSGFSVSKATIEAEGLCSACTG